MMGKDELTLEEKATLLGHVDSRFRDDYDEKVYNALCSMGLPQIEKLDARIRRALARYIFAFWEEFKKNLPGEFDSDTIVQAALTATLVTGYEVGRKLKRPIYQR